MTSATNLQYQHHTLSKLNPSVPSCDVNLICRARANGSTGQQAHNQWEMNKWVAEAWVGRHQATGWAWHKVGTRDVRGGLFFSAGRGGARVKIRGAGRGGAGQRWKSTGGAGRGGAKKRVNRLIPKILRNGENEKYNITYYDNNYKMLS